MYKLTYMTGILPIAKYSSGSELKYVLGNIQMASEGENINEIFLKYT